MKRTLATLGVALLGGLDRFKTHIICQSYPDSQDEVDDILRQHFFVSYVRVIYDP
jgi:hypothetical protein